MNVIIKLKSYESNLQGEDPAEGTADGQSSQLRNRSTSRSRLQESVSAFLESMNAE